MDPNSPRTHTATVNSPAGRFSERAIGSGELSRHGELVEKRRKEEKNFFSPASHIAYSGLLAESAGK